MAEEERHVLTNLNLPPEYNYDNAPTRSIVVTAAAANGWQLSTTRRAFVRYSITINTSISLSGGSTGRILLEVCPMNSSTAVDWKEIGRLESGQSGALVVGLSLNQSQCAQITGNIPIGHYVRLRSVNVAGSPSYSINNGQEVLL